MDAALNKVVIHCKGLIFDDAGRLLLIKQAEWFGTYWNAPGGRMEAGDTLESCLAREVKEETGLIVESAQLVYSHSWVSPGYTDIYMGFHVSKFSGELGVGTSLTDSEQDEFLETRFVGIDEQLEEPLFPDGLWDVAKQSHAGTLDGVHYLGTGSTDGTGFLAR